MSYVLVETTGVCLECRGSGICYGDYSVGWWLNDIECSCCEGTGERLIVFYEDLV